MDSNSTWIPIFMFSSVLSAKVPKKVKPARYLSCAIKDSLGVMLRASQSGGFSGFLCLF